MIRRIATLGTLLFACAMLLAACTGPKNTAKNSRPALLDNNTFDLTEITTDDSYGYSEKNPINVGGADKSQGPTNQRRFLNALAGPNGEDITYHRQGSCCPFKTKNGFMGGGLLDRYEVTWPGQAKPVVLFINFYDYGPLKVPAGFTLKKKQQRTT